MKTREGGRETRTARDEAALLDEVEEQETIGEQAPSEVSCSSC
jgi:hypothetical protein